MNNYKTLSFYLAKIFSKQFFMVSAIIIFVLFVTNIFDALQQFKSSNMTTIDFLKIVSFKVPYLFNEVATITCFISTFIFLRSITKQNEIVIILGSGVPIWRIFIAPVISTFIIGILLLGIVNPIGTFGLQSYNELKAKIKNTPRLNFVISQSGIFFSESFAGDNRIIQAESINASTKSLTNITVLLVDKNNNLTKRIDAPSAQLKTGIFQLNEPIITMRDSSEKLEIMNLPTNLSIDNLMQRYNSPEMVPIWKFNKLIANFSRLGLVTTKYQIYYYKQLFKPITMVAMSLIACWFISLNIRDNSGARIVILGLITGICTFFFLEMALRIFSYSGLHPMLATLLPNLFIILVSNFVILHFQEG